MHGEKNTKCFRGVMSITGGRNVKREFIYSGNSRGHSQILKPSSFSSRKEGEMVKVVSV